LIVTQVKSICEKRDSSRVIIFLIVIRVESGSQNIVTRFESDHSLASHYISLVTTLAA